MANHLAFDLDALPKVSPCARAAKVEPGVIAWGLLQMWEWCWRGKRDNVTDVHVRGFFGCDAAPALLAFGFLDETAKGIYRVKGADRYLRIQAGRSAGGHAAKSNLIPGGPNAKPRVSRESAEAEPSGDLGSPSGFQRTANSEQRSLKDQAPTPEPAPAAPDRPPSRSGTGGKPRSRKEKPVDPRWRPLQEAICLLFLNATGHRYGWQGAKDSEPLKWLMGQADDEEILRRLKFGLEATGWLHVATVAQLRAKWNDLASAGGAQAPPRPRFPDCTVPGCTSGQGASAHGPDGQPCCYPCMAEFDAHADEAEIGSSLEEVQAAFAHWKRSRGEAEFDIGDVRAPVAQSGRQLRS